MADWGAAASGAASGAVAGSTFGPWGAAVGGVVGGAAGLFSKKKKKKKRSSLDKRQQKLNEEQYAALHGDGPFADLYNYNPEMANKVFDETIANPAYRKFHEELAPGVTGQFRSKGLMHSSYAGDAVARLARDIQENLNAQRSNYLYGKEQSAQQAKQNAMENYQNRQTFAYDNSPQSGGFNMNDFTDLLTPENVRNIKQWYNTPGGKAGGNVGASL